MAVAAALVRFSVLALSRGMQHALVETTVRRHAGALTVLYPRHAGHWRNIWANALNRNRGSMHKNASSLAAVAAWLGHPDAAEFNALVESYSRRTGRHTDVTGE